MIVKLEKRRKNKRYGIAALSGTSLSLRVPHPRLTVRYEVRSCRRSPKFAKISIDFLMEFWQTSHIGDVIRNSKNMKFYFSSFKIGDNPNLLKNLLPKKVKAVYISNALDFLPVERIEKNQIEDLKQLKGIDVNAEKLDLRNFFGKQEELANKLKDVNLVYVSGGNTFDLRIAMNLSGFDKILLNSLHTEKIYAGYSAAVCVLSSTLKGYHLTDEPNLKTYGEHETLWEGVGVIDWQFACHYDSDHHESESANEEIEYYKKNKMNYRPLRDGDVIIEEIF